MSKIKLSDAKCTSLAFSANVNLARDAEGEPKNFELTGYTGAAVSRWWGKIVVKLAGISSKQQMPIFKNHNQNEIVGYSTSVSNEPVFTVNGIFSKETDAAREVMGLAKEGFPWQASIGVNPKAVTEIKSGESMHVNGVTVAGPAEVWTESEVYETSFVPLGADSNTSAQVFSDIKEVDSMSNQNACEQKNYSSLEAAWNQDEALQAEFAGDLEIYLAYFSDVPGVRVQSVRKGAGSIKVEV